MSSIQNNEQLEDNNHNSVSRRAFRTHGSWRDQLHTEFQRSALRARLDVRWLGFGEQYFLTLWWSAQAKLDWVWRWVRILHSFGCHRLQPATQPFVSWSCAPGRVGIYWVQCLWLWSPDRFSYTHLHHWAGRRTGQC